MNGASYKGACHCGAIGFRYSTVLEPSAWSVRACQCSFCRAHDAQSTSDPDGQLEFHTRDAAMLQRYRFGLGTADFLLCRNCGVYIGAAIESDFGVFGIINIHALSPAPTDTARASPITYDEENTEGRIARRGQRWTPVVGSP